MGGSHVVTRCFRVESLGSIFVLTKPCLIESNLNSGDFSKSQEGAPPGESEGACSGSRPAQTGLNRFLVGIVVFVQVFFCGIPFSCFLSRSRSVRISKPSSPTLNNSHYNRRRVFPLDRNAADPDGVVTGSRCCWRGRADGGRRPARRRPP